jgi:hypothetical protein
MVATQEREGGEEELWSSAREWRGEARAMVEATDSCGGAKGIQGYFL